MSGSLDDSLFPGSMQSLVKEGLFSTVKTTTSGPALQSLFHVLVDRHGVPVTGL